MELLARLFIRDSRHTDDPRVRAAYGTLCSAVAIALNILLAAAKFAVGTLVGSVSITADAMNNLSDVGSGALTLVGFRLSGKKPDLEHPFGHGRIEYVMGLVIAGLILYAGIDALRGALGKLLHPEPMEFTWAAAAVLVLSILVKIYMSVFYRRIGRKIGSTAMEMPGADALNDTISTALTLVCLLVYKFTGLDLDAYAGIIVAVVFARVKKLKLAALTDLAALGLLLGQIIGRWANFINREAFGAETTLPWRMRLWATEYRAIEVHPTFFYESAWNLIGLLLILFVVSKARRFDGENTCFYFLWYGIGRFWIEGLRTDSLYLFDWTLFGEPIRVSQALSLVLAIVGAVGLFYMIRVRKSTSDGLYVNQIRAAAEAAAASAEAAEAVEADGTAETVKTEETAEIAESAKTTEAAPAQESDENTEQEESSHGSAD